MRRKVLLQIKSASAFSYSNCWFFFGALMTYEQSCRKALNIKTRVVVAVLKQWKKAHKTV
jgi:hypothetical protein